MYRTRFNIPSPTLSPTRSRTLSLTQSLAMIGMTLALVAAPRTAVFAQSAAKIISSEISISRERAEIKLELDDGRKVTLATAAGAERGLLRSSGVPGNEIFTLGVQRGDAVDRSWRELLNNAMEAQTGQLAPMLRDWTSPAASGAELDRTLDSWLSGSSGATAQAITPLAPGVPADVVRERDSLARETERLREQLENARGDAIDISRHRRGPDWLAPLRHVGRGITGIFATLVTYAVLFGLGFLIVLFGGRKYIEGVADTARAGIGRSFLVGLAGSFLLLPVFVLGVIALAISIVGIPALLVWIPLFPIGTLLACLLGFLGVAHAAGESWAERRYYGGEWMTRANSYYFMATGLALLSSLFMAAHIITMAGPWLGFINNILNFLGIMLTWTAATIGFGAVLISRGGSRVANTVETVDTTSFEGANA